MIARLCLEIQVSLDQGVSEQLNQNINQFNCDVLRQLLFQNMALAELMRRRWT